MPTGDIDYLLRCEECEFSGDYIGRETALIDLAEHEIANPSHHVRYSEKSYLERMQVQTFLNRILPRSEIVEEKISGKYRLTSGSYAVAANAFREGAAFASDWARKALVAEPFQVTENCPDCGYTRMLK